MRVLILIVSRIYWSTTLAQTQKQSHDIHTKYSKSMRYSIRKKDDRFVKLILFFDLTEVDLQSIAIMYLNISNAWEWVQKKTKQNKTESLSLDGHWDVWLNDFNRLSKDDFIQQLKINIRLPIWRPTTNKCIHYCEMRINWKNSKDFLNSIRQHTERIQFRKYWKLSQYFSQCGGKPAWENAFSQFDLCHFSFNMPLFLIRALEN